MAEAFIIDAVRTPRSIGKMGKGALSHMHPQHVAATVLALLREDERRLELAVFDADVLGVRDRDRKNLARIELGRLAQLMQSLNHRFRVGELHQVELQVAIPARPFIVDFHDGAREVVGDDFIRGRVPVDARTRQPYGLLHGGVSVVLAETLGSCGAVYACKPGTRCVGLDINANHIRGAMAGWVTGITKPVHVGRSTQVWAIELFDDAGNLTCVSRITMAVLKE